MRDLAISDSLALPIDYVTKTSAILAQRRKGKTHTASVIAEELVDAGVPWVALDPTGAWWGLRAGAGGDATGGLPVTILGGHHGDIPLERTSGKLIADLVVEQPSWYVLDFGLFESKEADRQFATDFAERLYRRKGQEGGDSALHVFVDEADLFVPQQSPSGDKRMVGAFETLVRRGGIRGIGTTLISQRAAVVNKNVLEMLDMLVVLRTVGPNDRKAIDGYIEAYATPEERKLVMGSLASLEIGEGWIYEPGEQFLERVRIRSRRTFNSSATPKAGEKRVEPKGLAAVDLEVVKEQMAASVERARATDPKELQKRIRDLEQELASRAPQAPETIVETIEVERMPRAVLEAAHGALDAARVLASDAQRVASATAELVAICERAEASPASAPSRSGGGTMSRTPNPRHGATGGAVTTSSAARQAATPTRADTDGSLPRLSGAPLKIMHVLVRYPDGCSKSRVAMLAGVSQKKSTLRNAVSTLRTAGYITASSDPIIPTREGIDAIGEPDPLPTGEDLLAHWNAQLNPSEQACLAALMHAYPNELDNVTMAEMVGMEPGKSTLRNARSRLRVLGLAAGMRADDDFMASING